MATVAAATGRSLRAVGRDPYALTLWTFDLLERKGAFEREAERFDLASKVRLAVWGGDELAAAARRFVRDLVAAPAGASPNRYPTGPTQAEIVAHYDAAIQGKRWVDARGNPVEVPI